MPKPMDGIRVVELAQWMLTPAAGAILADWGADVVKIEHPIRADAQRGVSHSNIYGTEEGIDPFVEHANRGKRSIGLDVSTPSGRAILDELIRTADVFTTNLLPAALEKLAIEPDDIWKINPQTVYVRGSANGRRGPLADKGGFDYATFWARTGACDGVTPDDQDAGTPMPGMAYGDTVGAMTIAGGTAAALLHRERTGEATTVDVSLLGAGLWAMGPTIIASMANDAPAKMPFDRYELPNPLVASYRTSDGRLISLMIMQAFHYWSDFAAAIGHPELASDERFATPEGFRANTAVIIDLLIELFATSTQAEWSTRLSQLTGAAVWAPVQTSLEVSTDPQVLANDYIVQVEDGNGATFGLVASPVEFGEESPRLRRAPEAFEHTEAILLELGMDWEQISAAKTAGAVT
jgi:crotonobetainyl-CoA:carnitine CoA-transferase CaiB-like acyl-CoA transferase